MPRLRDPQRARQRIITSAALEFSRCGYAGARVDQIAALARVNKRMLYHYFGDKRELYLAVLEAWLPAPGAAVPALDPLSARLLLWTLLEGAASQAASERLWNPALLAAAVRTLATDGQHGGSKPRVRLKPAVTRRGTVPERTA
jgi:AcrR family transcriptional regulator